MTRIEKLRRFVADLTRLVGTALNGAAIQNQGRPLRASVE